MRVQHTARAAFGLGAATTALAGFSCTLGQAPAHGLAESTMTAASPSSGTPAAGRSTNPQACFGDSQPQTVAAGEREPTDLLSNGRELFWLSAFSIRRMDLATQKVSSLIAAFEPSGHPDGVRNLVAVDDRDLFLLRAGPRGGAPELAAVELSTGQGRIVAREPYVATNTPAGDVASTPFNQAVSQMFANEMFASSDYAVDKTYVYFAFYKSTPQWSYYSQHPEAMKGSHDLGFLSRVRRDGSGSTEVLGAGPPRSFIASEGYAYWMTPLEGIKRRALVPGAADEIVLAMPDKSYPWPMFVDGGRLFFATRQSGPPPSFAIVSVPAKAVNISAADAGGVDVQTHVASCQFTFGGGHRLFDGKCIYSGSYLGVGRVDIDDGKEQELITGPRNIVPASARSFVATDGRSLYWADYTRDRIVRWAR